jgi:hypothetical protein
MLIIFRIWVELKGRLRTWVRDLLPAREYRANKFQILKAPSDQNVSQRSLIALVVGLSMILVLQILTLLVDPDQACDNITYARVQNSEVCLSHTLKAH